MRELWESVVGPLLQTIEPKLVVLTASGDDAWADALTDEASAAGLLVERRLALEIGVPEPDLLLVCAGIERPAGALLRHAVVVLFGQDPSQFGIPNGYRSIQLPAFGGVAVLIPEDEQDGPLRASIENLHMGPAAEDLMRRLEDARLRAEADPFAAEMRDARIEALTARLESQADEIVDLRARLAVAAPGRDRTSGLRAETTSKRPNADASEQELLEQESERRFNEVYDTDALLAALGWPGVASDLALPIPFDLRNVLATAESAAGLVTVPATDPRRLMKSVHSALTGAGESIAVDVLLAEEPDPDLSVLLDRMTAAAPEVEVVNEPRSVDRPKITLSGGDVLPPGWPHAPRHPRSVGYILPGAPAGGSGGSHSVFQEAAALGEMGIDTRVYIPRASEAGLREIYPESAGILRSYSGEHDLLRQLADVEIAIATEHPSVAVVVDAARAHRIASAYYVQDYEPLFAPLGSPRADAAVLSYRADPGLHLFAKTHWLANVVAARHQRPVAKVAPSLDHRIFNRNGRVKRQGDVLQIAAMLRPRTPRRRPVATAKVLSLLAARLGSSVEIVTFGCESTALSDLPADTHEFDHKGVLSRTDVAELLRETDVFIDLSVYQAFGRTGLEAMACGAIPVLPSCGGVAEYAEHDRNALLVDGSDHELVVEAVAALINDPARWARLVAAGAETVTGFTLERSARSIADCLGLFLETTVD